MKTANSIFVKFSIRIQSSLTQLFLQPQRTISWVKHLKQIFETNSLDDLQNLVINIEDKLIPVITSKRPRKNEQEQ